MGVTLSGVNFWEGAIVPFEIDPNFDNPDRVFRAIREHYETLTNLRFVRRSRQSSFLLFVNGRSCESFVGVEGKPNQRVTCRATEQVPAPKEVPVIIHEIGHAVGLTHEHQRSDRDQFVDVQEENIRPGEEDQFKMLDSTLNLTDYDFRSIMHYEADAFSANDESTIVPMNDPNQELDNSDTLTTLDVVSLNELYPQVGIVRRSDSGVKAAGRVTEIAVVNEATPSRLVTAVRTNEGTLRLIRWTVNEKGGIRRQTADSGTDAGKASSIAVARGRLVVTAVRTADGELKLISWTLSDSAIDRVGDSGDDAGRASVIRLLALTSEVFVTACRDASGQLKLITWRLNSSDDNLERLKSNDEAGDVSEISFVRVRPSGTGHLVATTVRTAEGTVKTIIWRISAAGAIEKKGNSGNSIKEGTLIESAMQDATGFLVVSCRTNEGILRLFTLAVSPDGSSVLRQFDSENQAGNISRNALLQRPVGALSAVRADGGNIRLIRWRIDSEGRIFRLGDSTLRQAGGVGIVRLAGETGQAHAPIVTCVQTEDDDLRLISWDDEPANGELT